MSRVPQLTPLQFSADYRSGDTHDPNVVLLDVREDSELEIAHVEGAAHVPMSRIENEIGKLDKTRTYVVMCHSGARSHRVAMHLKASGFPDVFNLAGGIDAWSRQVDPSVPRY
jgi:rhodanese-related sulfurtransferase